MAVLKSGNPLYNLARKGATTRPAPTPPTQGYTTSTRAPPPPLRKGSSVKSAIEKAPAIQRRNSRGAEASLSDTYSRAFKRRVSSGYVFERPEAVEITMVKEHQDDSLGLTVTVPAEGSGCHGVLVIKARPTVANAPVKGLLAKGAVIHEIATNQTGGEKWDCARLHYKEVAELLRNAEGIVTLTVSTATVPSGWVERRDAKGEIYYLNDEQRLKTYDHPAAHAGAAAGAPPTAVELS